MIVEARSALIELPANIKPSRVAISFIHGDMDLIIITRHTSLRKYYQTGRTSFGFHKVRPQAMHTNHHFAQMWDKLRKFLDI
jgi:hypothetical protein